MPLENCEKRCGEDSLPCLGAARILRELRASRARFLELRQEAIREHDLLCKRQRLVGTHGTRIATREAVRGRCIRRVRVAINRHGARPRKDLPCYSAPAREPTCEDLIARQLDAKTVLLAALEFAFVDAVI